LTNVIRQFRWPRAFMELSQLSTRSADANVCHDGYEERLEAEGATIIDSTTFFPASNTRITKRSQTPEERAEQRTFE
jgi:hypothetical protein